MTASAFVVIAVAYLYWSMKKYPDHNGSADQV